MKRRQAKNPREHIIRQTKATSVRQEEKSERKGPEQQKNAGRGPQSSGDKKDFVGMDIDLMNYTDI